MAVLRGSQNYIIPVIAEDLTVCIVHCLLNCYCCAHRARIRVKGLVHNKWRIADIDNPSPVILPELAPLYHRVTRPHLKASILRVGELKEVSETFSISREHMG